MCVLSLFFYSHRIAFCCSNRPFKLLLFHFSPIYSLNASLSPFVPCIHLCAYSLFRPFVSFIPYINLFIQSFLVHSHLPSFIFPSPTASLVIRRSTYFNYPSISPPITYPIIDCSLCVSVCLSVHLSMHASRNSNVYLSLSLSSTRTYIHWSAHLSPIDHAN